MYVTELWQWLFHSFSAAQHVHCTAIAWSRLTSRSLLRMFCLIVNNKHIHNVQNKKKNIKRTYQAYFDAQYIKSKNIRNSAELNNFRSFQRKQEDFFCLLNSVSRLFHQFSCHTFSMYFTFFLFISFIVFIRQNFSKSLCRRWKYFLVFRLKKKTYCLNKLCIFFWRQNKKKSTLTLTRTQIGSKYNGRTKTVKMAFKKRTRNKVFLKLLVSKRPPKTRTISKCFAQTSLLWP